MQLAQALKNKLDDLGITIYIGYFPSAPDTAMVIRETPGSPVNPKHGYASQGIQLITRSDDYEVAYNLAFSGFGLLIGNNSYKTISGVHVVDILANQPPYYAGYDGLDRHSFTQNYSVHYIY